MRRGIVWLFMGLASSPVVVAQQLEACTVLSVTEIKATLGRDQVGAPKAHRASGGYSDCTAPCGRRASQPSRQR